MAIQPTIRLAGSSHILRFQGTLREQSAPGAQIVNGEVPQGAIADVATPVKFALADMTALTDLSKQLPAVAYDDSQPAGSAPHSNATAGGPAAGLFGVPAGKTWMQNVRIRAQEASASTAAPLIARVDTLTPSAEIDGAPGSGLGLEQSTGIPVIAANIFFTAAGIAVLAAGVPFVLEVEVPHSSQR